MSFAQQLEAFVRVAPEDVDRTVRAIKLELFRSVIMDTPVDTGRARGNWQATVGAPAGGTLDSATATDALASVQANLGKLSDVSWLTNNLPYIARLEDGYSKQAPAGMVRRNMARIQRIINEKAAQNRR
jgi:hypothetical protein